ncbi:hypothetical protein V8G54_036765 [Vigna mungo]|uniref:Uncharacterized protein n=1 Tax=Vigna mungo TaxID=3915 RepID=A0AAQ3MHV2_VIGMU
MRRPHKQQAYKQEHVHRKKIRVFNKFIGTDKSNFVIDPVEKYLINLRRTTHRRANFKKHCIYLLSGLSAMSTTQYSTHQGQATLLTMLPSSTVTRIPPPNSISGRKSRIQFKS